MRLDEKTKDVAVSMYEGSTGERFIQVAINDKDGTVQKAWLTAGGAILLHEPVDGIAAEDIARTLASKK